MPSKLNHKDKFGLSQFGLIMSLFLLVLHVVLKRTDSTLPYIVMGLLAVTLFFPGILSPINKLWIKFGDLLGKVIGPIILSVVYFLFLTPVAFLRRLAGGKGLGIDFNSSPDTFWKKRQEARVSPADVERQF
jgi:Saxitoxin biosynthesis operon protein SxtJ